MYATQYVTLCILTEMNATELVMCTALIVTILARCCNCI